MSQRIKLLESIVQSELFSGNDFDLTHGVLVPLGVVSESLCLHQSCSLTT